MDAASTLLTSFGNCSVTAATGGAISTGAIAEAQRLEKFLAKGDKFRGTTYAVDYGRPIVSATQIFTVVGSNLSGFSGGDPADRWTDFGSAVGTCLADTAVENGSRIGQG